jgi:hypothetical protein
MSSRQDGCHLWFWLGGEVRPAKSMAGRKAQYAEAAAVFRRHRRA